MMREVEQYKKLLGKHLVIDDWEGVELILAAIATHWIPGNMFWFRIIGASGTGKSEILRSLEYNSVKYKDAPDEQEVISADSFTPGSIRGGYLKDTPRMLELWNGKLVVTKDFASMITKKKEDRSEVFGLLRSAWDGTISAFYGSEDAHVKLKFHFDWILASTPLIERQRSLEIELGSRFIDLKWRSPNNEDAAICMAMDEDEHLIEFRNLLGEHMDAVMKIAKRNLSEKAASPKWLAPIARVTARLRTPIMRDSRQEVYDIPTPELGTRLGQSLMRVVKGLTIIGVEDPKPYIKRLAFDCLPGLRSEIVRAKLEDPTISAKDLADRTRVSLDTIYRAGEELKMLGWGKEYWEILKN